MSAPAVAVARAVAVPADWRRSMPPLALGLVLLGLLFNREIVAAIRTWDDSTAYNHCFLVIPIALYLLWERRRDLTGVHARPMPAALLLGLPLAVVWLAAERLGIMEGRQLAAVSFVEILFLAVLGRRLWWAMAGPLLYLYFVVPFGAFLTPKLQDITTFFIRHGLDILGVPAYIDGYIIEIPQGTFFVAEACAGLRFLIASIAFGCLYALLMYRSPMRRGVFILVSIIVPIIANGFRGIGIVYLGYLLGSAQAAAADHIIYGWIFFSVVILVLIALGLPFRQDDIPTRSATTEEAGPLPPVRLGFAAAVGVVAVAALTPGVAAALSRTAFAVPVPGRIDVGPDCMVQPEAAAPGVVIRSERVLCAGMPLEVSWAAFSPHATAAPLMAARRRMVIGALTEGLQENWLDPADGTASPWRIMSTSDPSYAIAVAVWVDGKPVRPSLRMRLRMALNSLAGSSFTPMVVTVTPVVNWEAGDPMEIKAAQASLPHFLLTHRGLDRTVSALSAMH